MASHGLHGLHGLLWPLIPDPLARLQVLLDSSTPIVAIETIEEVRAVRLVRAACAASTSPPLSGQSPVAWSAVAAVGEVAVDGPHSTSYGAAAQQALANSKAIYNRQEPAQMLANLEGISIGAAFILKDLHRHMDEPVVVRRLRDVGQKFSENRRTIILTSPKIEIPLELRGLVEFLALPPPDRRRLRQIIDEVVVRISRDHTLQQKLDAKGFEAVVESQRGLTEEASERALSQPLVACYALCPETASHVLETRKSLLRRALKCWSSRKRVKQFPASQLTTPRSLDALAQPYRSPRRALRRSRRGASERKLVWSQHQRRTNPRKFR
jgi:hypothetical protein